MTLRLSLAIATVMGLALIAARLGAAPLDAKFIAEAVEDAAPSGWQVVRVEPGQIPRGHHWGRSYNGPRGTLIVIMGPADVFLSWADSEGDWHREAVAKESIRLWIMPPEYRNDFWSFLDIHGPVQPHKLLATEHIRAYARPAHELTSEARIHQLLDEGAARETAWPDSPANTGTLSWSTWKSELERALRELGNR